MGVLSSFIEDLCAPHTVLGASSEQDKACLEQGKTMGIIEASKKTEQGKRTLRAVLYFIKANEGGSH